MLSKRTLRVPHGSDVQHRSGRGVLGSWLSSMGPLLTLLGALACNAPLHRCASDPECSTPEWCDTSVGVCVRHWNGHEWISWGSLNPAGSAVSALAMGLGEGRAPLASWVVEAGTGTTARLAVAAWTGNGGPPSDRRTSPRTTRPRPSEPVLGTNSKGQPVALWVESSGGAQRVFMSTIEGGTTWRQAELSPPCIGTFLLDAADGVINVCSDTTSRWDTVDWIPLGGTIPVGSYQSNVTVGATSGGWPVVGWMEKNGPAPTFKARRFNR